MADQRRHGGRAVTRWLGALAAGWLVALGVNRSLLRIEGSSMAPTLVAGQLVLTLPAWVPGVVRPGRIVVASDPRAPSRTLVKRLARVDGDRAWLEGDNPLFSTDSRTFGAVPASSVRRVVVARLPR